MQLYLLLILVLCIVPLIILDLKRPHSLPHRSSPSRSLCCWALLYNLPLIDLFSFSTSNMRRISKWLFYLLRLSLIIILIEVSSHFGNLSIELTQPATIVLILLLPLLLLPSSIPYSIFNYCGGREADYKSKPSVFDEKPFNCKVFFLLFSFFLVFLVTALTTIFLFGNDQSSQKLIALLIILAISIFYALIKISIAVSIVSKGKNKCCRCFFVDLITAALAQQRMQSGQKEEKKSSPSSQGSADKNQKRGKRVLVPMTVRDKLRESQRKNFESKV